MRSNHVRELDALRGIAIIGVLLTHGVSTFGLLGMDAPGTSFDLTQFFVDGGLGVPLFFVLSGFLLTTTESKRTATGQGSVAAYARRRFLRLAPAYYCSLALYLAVALLMGTYRPWANPWLDGLAYLSFLHGFATSGANINYAYWSLTPEVVFYVSLPLILRHLRSFRARLAAYGCCVTAAAVGYYLYGTGPKTALGWYLVFNPLTHMHMFLLGSLIATLALDHRQTVLARLPVGTGDFLFLAALVETSFDAYLVPTAPAGIMLSRLCTETMVGLGFAAYVIGSPLFLKVLALPGLASLGRMSYSLFLFHAVVAIALARSGITTLLRTHALQGTPHLAMLALYLVALGALSVGLASLTYRFIELPGMHAFGLRRKDEVTPSLVVTVAVAEAS